MFALLAYSPVTHATELKPADGAAKPDFTLLDLDGRAVSLNALRGRVVLVHFFATWCEPCREELPALNRFLKRSAASATVIAVSVADADQRVRRFFDQTPVGFPVLLDRDRTVAKSWSVSALPTTYILDASMKPVLAIDSDFPWDTVDIDPSTGKLLENKTNGIKAASENSNLR
jgi:peroxiredoxin